MTDSDGGSPLRGGAAEPRSSATDSGGSADDPVLAEPTGPERPEPAPGVPATPTAAAAVFGTRLSLAEEFVTILADTGISHGLIGPREAPRLWDRHVLNCGLVHHVIPVGRPGQRVIDIGSGAGLPGLVLAIARPDLEVHLVEPLARRTGWLSGVTAQLGLENVVIHTARAESMWDRISAPWVTARAVSGILQLAHWTLPLLEPRGSLLALKGSRAGEELREHRAALTRLGVVDAGVEVIGAGLAPEPTIVLRVTIGESIDRRRFRIQTPSSAGSARRRADRPKGGRGTGSASRTRGRRTT